MGVGRMHKGTQVDNSSESSPKMDDLNTGKSSLEDTIEANYYVPKIDARKKHRDQQAFTVQIFCSPKIKKSDLKRVRASRREKG